MFYMNVPSPNKVTKILWNTSALTPHSCHTFCRASPATGCTASYQSSAVKEIASVRPKKIPLWCDAAFCAVPQHQDSTLCVHTLCLLLSSIYLLVIVLQQRWIAAMASKVSMAMTISMIDHNLQIN